MELIPLLALLRVWDINGGVNPVKIKRTIIMKSAKINARHMYNKRMNELHEFGYIIYGPTSNQYNTSLIYLKQTQ